MVPNREIRAAIYSPRLRLYDSVQGGNKAIDHDKVDTCSRNEYERLNTIPEETYWIRSVSLEILHVKH